MAAFSSQKSTFVQKNAQKNVDEIDTYLHYSVSTFFPFPIRPLQIQINFERWFVNNEDQVGAITADPAGILYPMIVRSLSAKRPMCSGTYKIK